MWYEMRFFMSVILPSVRISMKKCLNSLNGGKQRCFISYFAVFFSFIILVLSDPASGNAPLPGDSLKNTGVQGDHYFIADEADFFQRIDSMASIDSLMISDVPEFLKEPVIPVLKDMRLEVNIRTRELYVYDGSDRVATYPVAVGKPDWPTRTGNWSVYEVVWNPWWHPPDEEWAWYRAIMAPGDPDNPLGRAQLIYDAPRSIHGTIDPSSIGRAASHGSIRVTNEVAMKLARQIMESTGLQHDEDWYRDVQQNRSKNVRIRLSERIPIRVYQ